jgi:hypothetical protein
MTTATATPNAQDLAAVPPAEELRRRLRAARDEAKALTRLLRVRAALDQAEAARLAREASPLPPSAVAPAAEGGGKPS